MRKTLLSALVVIALTAQLTGCNGNTPVEQPNESSSVVSDVSEPQNSTSSSETESSSEPYSNTVSSTVSSAISSTTSSTIVVESEVPAPEPQDSTVTSTTSSSDKSDPPPVVKDMTWTETAASGTYYINAICSSNAMALIGSNVVKTYKLNDTVNVIAKTDTGYYKLADGEFIHGDYLSTSKVEQPSDGNNNGGSTGAAKPYEGTKHTPDEGATIIETQTGVTRSNNIVTIYTVQTDGGTYYFNEATGSYYSTMQDALNMRNHVLKKYVFPNGDWDFDWSGITVW